MTRKESTNYSLPTGFSLQNTSVLSHETTQKQIQSQEPYLSQRRGVTFLWHVKGSFLVSKGSEDMRCGESGGVWGENLTGFGSGPAREVLLSYFVIAWESTVRQGSYIRRSFSSVTSRRSFSAISLRSCWSSFRWSRKASRSYRSKVTGNLWLKYILQIVV